MKSNIVSKGNVVIAERLNRTIVGGGKMVDLPSCGAFEMANGKIKVRRSIQRMEF